MLTGLRAAARVCRVVTAAEVREFVLWLQRTMKPHHTPRKKTATTAGTINPITRKQHPGDQYAVRTIRHSNAVIRSFYEFWIERRAGPLVARPTRDLVRSEPSS